MRRCERDVVPVGIRDHHRVDRVTVTRLRMVNAEFIEPRRDRVDVVDSRRE